MLNPHCSMVTLVLSIGQNMQPFNGKGDVPKWVKNSQVGRKKTKQTSKTGIMAVYAL